MESKPSKYAKYRQTGDDIKSVITDHIARQAWKDLLDTHGGPKAALTSILRTHYYANAVDSES
jgi:hypothetical protein